jgi:hypothetical protein
LKEIENLNFNKISCRAGNGCVEKQLMFWLQLYGPGPDGKTGFEQVSTPFPTIEAAVEKARVMAAEEIFYWGKATDFRVSDEARAVVCEGSFDLINTLKALKEKDAP